MKINESQLAGYIQEFNKHLDYIKLILEPYRDLIEIERDIINRNNRDICQNSMINVYKNNKDQQRIISIVKRFYKVK